MRIGIDGRELLGQRTGVGHYLAALCADWLRDQSLRHHLVVYVPTSSAESSALGDPFVEPARSAFTVRPVAGRAGTWWEQMRLPPIANQDGLDAFFAPAYSAPLQVTAPVVLTMHDVSFAAHPEWFRWREGLRRRWLAAQAMGRAAAVVTDSEFSRREILRLFDVPGERLHVVPLGVRQELSAPVSGSTSSLVLFAGSIFNRRHLPTLIRAFAKVLRVHPDAELAIVGADRTYPPQDLAAVAADCDASHRITFRPYVDDRALRELYARAGVFVFLSEYEGFGLPPLEAMAAGVPVVVGDTPAAREVYGDAALRVPPDDAAAAADAVVTLLNDDGLRTQQRRHADALLGTLSWTRAARATLSVIEAAAGDRARNRSV